jgi:hypothetical protein
MEDIQKLVDIIHQRKQRQYPLLELKNVNDHSTKENIFYHHVKKKEFKNDDEAAGELYGSKGDDDRYRMLKSRLKQKLLNHMFFLDLTDNNQRNAIVFEQECIDHLHQARMLDFVDETKISKNLVLKALTTAERCEFTKYIIASCEELLKIYSENYQPHLFDETQAKLKESRQLYTMEDEVRTQYLFTRMMILKSVNSRKKNLDAADEIILHLEKLWSRTKSYNVFHYLIQLKLLVWELRGEFLEIIPILREIETGQYRGITLNVYRMDLQSIILSLAFAYFRGKKYEEGLKYIKKHAGLIQKKSSAWFRLHETYFLTAMFSADYELAADTIESVRQSDGFEELSEDELAKWKLYYMYLLLMKNGHPSLLKHYRQVIETVPENVGGKEGFNLAIFILQFIYYLEASDMQRLTAIRNELKGYMANHFKENFSYRSRTFYKLMNIVVENKLDQHNIQLKSRYLFKKLHTNQIVGSIYPEYEIVPLETLWKMIVEKLKS